MGHTDRAFLFSALYLSLYPLRPTFSSYPLNFPQYQ